MEMGRLEVGRMGRGLPESVLGWGVDFNSFLINFMLQKLICHRFATNIVLLSSAPRYDGETAEIARMIKKNSAQEVNFHGIIGDAHSSLFKRVYLNSDCFDNEEMVVNRQYNHYWAPRQDLLCNPYRFKTHIRHFLTLRKLKQMNFFENIVKENVDAVITVGNVSLAHRIGENLNSIYAQHQKVKPYSVLVDQFVSERELSDEANFDFLYHRLARRPRNGQGYTFPSLCIGYERFYAAFQHLQQFKDDPNDDSFAFQYFGDTMDTLIRKSREVYRRDKNISQDKYIIYMDGGENQVNYMFTLNAFLNGLKEFLTFPRNSQTNIDNFQIFISLGEENQVDREAIKKSPHQIPGLKITYIPKAEKYSAICASDFGVVHNGHAPVEIAIMQLPALVVENMPYYRAYFTYLMNGHASPLNVSTNYEAYSDLCSQDSVVPNKIATLINDSYQNPKIRYYFAKLYNDEIQKILSRSGTNPEMRVGETGLTAASKHLIAKINNYRKAAAKGFMKERERKALIL